MATMVATRSSAIKIYINAVQQTLVGSSTISQWNGLDFQSGFFTRVGSYSDAGGANPFLPFVGRIAMTQVYFRSLSDAEILQNYNATKRRFGL
jgi:hypothetical protein